MSGARYLGRYEILGKLADGGMAEILLGRLSGPRGFEHAVVLKRMLPNLARSREFVDMFVDEAGIAAAVRHPNVVGVHELGREGEELFLVLEYLEGESVGGLLRRLWTRGVALDRRLAAHVIAEACAGVHAAHELCDDSGKPRDLVHRDVSPQNVFLTYRGQVKLLDFGIAKAAKRHTKTEAGQVKGKCGYMSPEQCYGRPLDRRSDIFSLGTLLYELSTGRRLFKRESELETLKAITEQSVMPPTQAVPGYPPELEVICLRALQRRREDRYSSAAEMRRDLISFVHAGNDKSLPEEALGALMQRVFADRIEQKREMLRRVREGSGLHHIPSAEVDETVEIPVILDEGNAQGTRSAFSALREPTAPRRATGATVWAVLAMGAVAAAAAGLAVRWSQRGTTGPPAVPSTSVTEIEAAASTPPETSAPDTSADTPREVMLHLESTPSGAEIHVDGVARGVTPGDVRIVRDDKPVLVELRRTGFETWRQAVLPEVDQRFSPTLRPHAVPRAAPPRPTTKPATSADPGYQKL